MMKRVVSGIRPTGYLHLGHLKGVLENFASLQNDHDTFYFIADIHSYTNNLSTEKSVFYYDMVRDMIASGINPEKSTIFIQSRVKEHAELAVMLSMATPLSWLERCPTFKDSVKDYKKNSSDDSGITLGLISYPVLMTADIVLYDADFVPVGQDQVAHLEISREIVRRFNRLFSGTFTEPKPLLTNSPLLLGPDRQKMSKSYGNCIYLNDNEDAVKKSVMSMITDPEKIRKDDPGRPDICNVFSYHKIFGDPKLHEIDQNCRSGSLGCVECKKYLFETLNGLISFHREKKSSISDEEVEKILKSGFEKATTIAYEKMTLVKKNMGMMI